jgi:hypothetical protein
MPDLEFRPEQEREAETELPTPEIYRPSEVQILPVRKDSIFVY